MHCWPEPQKEQINRQKKRRTEKKMLGLLHLWFVELKKKTKLDFLACSQMLWTNYSYTEPSHCKLSFSDACGLFADGRYKNTYWLACFNTCFSTSRRGSHKIRWIRVYFRSGLLVQDAWSRKPCIWLLYSRLEFGAGKDLEAAPEKKILEEEERAFQQEVLENSSGLSGK